jgi:hypothetical protein
MAYVNHGKTSSSKRNSGRKPNLSERNCRTSKRTVSRNRKLPEQRWQQNSVFILKTPIPQKKVRRDIHKPTIHGKAAIAKPLITENNSKWRKRCCDDHKTWTSDDWKYVIWSDESSFTLYPTSDRIYVWRTPKETYKPEWLVPTVKHEGGSVMIWAAVRWYPIITGRIIAPDYVDILGNQVHAMVQMLFPNNAIFQDDSSPIHTARSVQSWCWGALRCTYTFPWPAQSPDLNIIEPL